MNAIETATAVFGWCAVLNLLLLVLAAVVLLVAGDAVKRIHGGLYGLSDEDLDRAYFQYLAQYKIAIFVLNLGPYLALKIVG